MSAGDDGKTRQKKSPKKSSAVRPSFDLTSAEMIKPGELMAVPAPINKRIEASAFASWCGEAPIAQLLSGAVEIAKQRGFLFHTHREIGGKLEPGASVFAYALALAIAAAAGRERAPSICATVIQTTGALLVVRRPAAYAPDVVREAKAVFGMGLGL
jgi:hypothetical protein